MAPVTLFISFLLTNIAVFHSAEGCPPYNCNGIGNISFPFKYREHPPECGLYSVDCEVSPPIIQLKEGGYWHELTSISNHTISMIINEQLQKRLESSAACDEKTFEDLSLPDPSPISNLSTTSKLILLKCSNPLDRIDEDHKLPCSSDYHTYYNISSNHIPGPCPHCSVVQLLLLLPGWNLLNQPHSILTPNITLQVTVGKERSECLYRGGIWQSHEGEPFAPPLPPPPPKGAGKKPNLRLKLGLGIGLGISSLLAICFFFLWCYGKKCTLNFVLSRNISNADLEGSGVSCGLSVFTYKELEEATNHFDCEKEIGDGGFGIVYHGKLKDGREVAVKRLYEHNQRRAEQFMNEIDILTHLRHKHLVTLYGCTSQHSRNLLLVYEYIANGTVADHLYGDQAATSSLTWPIRMSIAKETASALLYLHASDIVHRDVKTTNILLDNNFSVKVADFGISRLFPLNATHVSTAPQGTAGYVDPEYHECYQLTTKSDVYSFGVVLIELISSLPAVDITRPRDEISLSNIAINKIQNGLYCELVDSCLGFESDPEVKRMTIEVADLAFQCLRQDRDARPNMWQVLEGLEKIESSNDVPKNQNPTFCDPGIGKSMQPPASPDCDQIELLKNIKAQSSPNSVTGKWPSSRSTTPNLSA